MIKIELLDRDIPAPKYALEGDAGLDCYSPQTMDLQPHERKLIPLGIKIELPMGKAAFVLPKSGLSSKVGLTATTGLIDSGYRGEIAMMAKNESDQVIHIKRGQKVCQLLIFDAPQEKIIYGKVNANTERGENGFGSTGLS